MTARQATLAPPVHSSCRAASSMQRQVPWWHPHAWLARTLVLCSNSSLLTTQLTARLPLLLAWSMRSMVLCSCVTRTSAGTLPPTPTSIRSPGTSSTTN